MKGASSRLQDFVSIARGIAPIHLNRMKAFMMKVLRTFGYHSRGAGRKTTWERHNLEQGSGTEHEEVPSGSHNTGSTQANITFAAATATTVATATTTAETPAVAAAYIPTGLAIPKGQHRPGDSTAATTATITPATSKAAIPGLRHPVRMQGSHVSVALEGASAAAAAAAATIHHTKAQATQSHGPHSSSRADRARSRWGAELDIILYGNIYCSTFDLFSMHA